MKTLATWFIRRLLVSVTLVIFIGASGVAWGHFFGPSAASLAILRLALPETSFRRA
jgi:hypothetical protein